MAVIKQDYGSLEEIGLAKLLWTNPSPTSNYSGGTISVNLSNYTGILVKIKDNTGANGWSITYIDKSLPSNQALRASTSERQRIITSISDTGVVFGAGYNASTQNNSYAIPWEIYGISIEYTS